MNKKVSLIGAPVDLGSSELGVKNGPDVFRQIGAERVFSDSEIKFSDLGDIKVFEDRKNLPQSPKLKNLAAIEKACLSIKKLTQKAIEGNNTPLIVGGDHSVALGSIAASLSKYPDLNLLWIDAHPDINTPETSLSGNIHGMVTSTLLGKGDPILVSLVDNKLLAKNLYFLGVKDPDKAETETIKKLNIYSLSVNDILLKGFGNALDGLFNNLRGKKVHVSLDLDSIDILDAPGVGIPSRGGFDYREIKYIAQEISKLDVVAMDIVELNPERDVNFQTARLALELAVTCLGGSYSMYYEYLKTQN